MVESYLVEEGTDRDLSLFSEHEFQAASEFWPWCLYLPLHDSLNVELMCSGEQTNKLGNELLSVLFPFVTQTGAWWPGFAAPGFLFVAFLHRRQDNMSGPRASF